MGLILQSFELTNAAHGFTRGSQRLSLSQCPISPKTVSQVLDCSNVWKTKRDVLGIAYVASTSLHAGIEAEQPLVHHPTKSFCLPSVYSHREDPTPQKGSYEITRDLFQF